MIWRQEWAVRFDSPLHIAVNAIAFVIYVLAVAIFVRGLVSERGLRFRDVLLLGGLGLSSIDVGSGPGLVRSTRELRQTWPHPARARVCSLRCDPAFWVGV